MNVTAVKSHPKNDAWAYIVFEDGTEAWCPEKAKAMALKIGKPLPGDWRQDVGDYGPRAFPPKDKKDGPKAAYRNTKEGQAAEQDSIHRSVALTQAVALYGHDTTIPRSTVLEAADALYQWLRGGPTGAGSSDAHVQGSSTDKPQVVPSTVTAAPPKIPSTGEKRQEPLVEGEATGGSCLHLWTDTKPDGSLMRPHWFRCEKCGEVDKR